MLSDRDLTAARDAGELSIEPWAHAAVQPNSYDLTLGRDFAHLDPHQGTIDPLAGHTVRHRRFTLAAGDRHELAPGSLLLATTAEVVTLGAALAARVEGRSSIGRLGLIVHSTAGFIDAGFRGEITLELANVGPAPVLITPDMGIAQLSVTRLDSPSARPYGHPSRTSKYQSQSGATPSRGVATAPRPSAIHLRDTAP